MSLEQLTDAWAEPDARMLPMRGAEVPVIQSREGSRLALLETFGSYPGDQRADRGASENLTVYVGRAGGRPIFANATSGEAGAPAGAEWMHPFAAAEQLEATEREVMAVASALLRWHDSARYSPQDGSLTQLAHGGWARLDEHGIEHFPRTDPAVIVLIEHEDHVLLGSNTLWETGRFSLLAGFVEAGESLEQTVRREVFEESGVRLGEVQYVASQPWPFPRSLMLGFRAKLAEGQDPHALVPDPTEISELRWFSRAQVETPDPGIMIPGGASIARWMLDAWVAEGDRGA